MCSDKCISHMFCSLLSACMSCAGSQDTRSVRVQIELLLQMSGGLVHCSRSDKSQSSSRSLNRATEDYLVRTIWLYRSSLYGGDVVTVTVIALFTLSVWRSLSSPALCHICSFSLRTDFEGKSQRARCWFLRSWLNRDPGTTCWFGMSVNVSVCVYVRNGAHAWLGPH